MRAQQRPRQLLVGHRGHVLAHRRDPDLLREQARDGPEIGDGSARAPRRSRLRRAPTSPHRDRSGTPRPAGCTTPWVALAPRYSPLQIGQAHSAHSTSSFPPPSHTPPPMFPSALGMTQHREIIPRTGTIAQAYSWFRTLNPAGRDACSPSSLGIGAYGPQREHVRPKTKLATPASGWRSISERFTAPIVAHAGHSTAAARGARGDRLLPHLKGYSVRREVCSLRRAVGILPRRTRHRTARHHAISPAQWHGLWPSGLSHSV